MRLLFGSSNPCLCKHSCRCSPFLYQGCSNTWGQREQIISPECTSWSRKQISKVLISVVWSFSSTWQVSGSVLSVYSGDFGSVDAQGTVEFALDYDEKNREFQVHVSQCKDLAVVDEKKDRTDPWVIFHFDSSWLLCWILCSEELSFFSYEFSCKIPSFLPTSKLLVHIYCWVFSSSNH